MYCGPAILKLWEGPSMYIGAQSVLGLVSLDIRFTCQRLRSR